MNYGMKPKNKKAMKSRKTIHAVLLTLVAAALAGLGACKDKAPSEPIVADTLMADTTEVADTTLYGRCGDGTAMHTLELVTDHGDTLYFGINNDSTAAVRGGLSVGDRLAVLPGLMLDGERQAGLVVNLTTLLGKWTALDKNFELQEGGVVVSNVTEPKPLTEWKICNGRLVLSADTFDVYELGADSLFLENDNGIYSYKRMR